MNKIQKIGAKVLRLKAAPIVSEDLYNNLMLWNNSASWVSLLKTSDYFKTFLDNPVVYSVVMIKANAFSNMRITVVEEDTGQEIPIGTTEPIPAKLYSLFSNPNPLQSTWEFLKQYKVFEQVAGNAFLYANLPIGFNKNIDIMNVNTLFNVWPQHMQVFATGKYFDAVTIDEIIEKWVFRYGSITREFNPFEILHRNAPNVDLKMGHIIGDSFMKPLKRPISNVNASYESRNVMIKNRGMRILMTSSKGDASGNVPLQPDELDELEDAFKDYGTLENQKQIKFSRFPLEATVIDQDVRKLGLFDEIATDAMIISNAAGVPEILLKLYLKGATFENQEASERRLYQGTIIPESKDLMIGLNNWLNLAGTGYRLVGSFDHVSVLQVNEKDNAESNSIKSKYLKDQFMAGAITYGYWMTELGQEVDPAFENKRIWDLEENQIAIILNKDIKPVES